MALDRVQDLDLALHVLHVLGIRLPRGTSSGRGPKGAEPAVPFSAPLLKNNNPMATACASESQTNGSALTNLRLLMTLQADLALSFLLIET